MNKTKKNKNDASYSIRLQGSQRRSLGIIAKNANMTASQVIRGAIELIEINNDFKELVITQAKGEAGNND